MIVKIRNMEIASICSEMNRLDVDLTIFSKDLFNKRVQHDTLISIHSNLFLRKMTKN